MYARTRGYLPHIIVPEGTYFITDRLEDSVPKTLLFRWKLELDNQGRAHVRSPEIIKNAERQYQTRVQTYLDTGEGECYLRRPEIASLVVGSLKFFNRQRYILHAWTVMPNHTHVLLTLQNSFTLASIMCSLKGYTSREANKLIGRSGEFWQREYFDRLITSQRQFEFTIRYIVNNPVKAGLCKEFYQWPWSGFSDDIEPLVRRYFL